MTIGMHYCTTRLSSIAIAMLAAMQCFGVTVAFTQPPAKQGAMTMANFLAVRGNVIYTHIDTPEHLPPWIAVFGATIGHGDVIETDKNSIGGILFGGDVQLILKQGTTAILTQETTGMNVVTLHRGSVCVATIGQSTHTDAAIVLRTPTAMVKISPGSSMSITVEPAQTLTPPAARHDYGEPVRASLTDHVMPPWAVPVAQSSASGREIFHVSEGRIQVDSRVPGAAVTVEAGSSIEVIDGKMGNPFPSPPISCRLQDLIGEPTHVGTPPEAADMIATTQENETRHLINIILCPPVDCAFESQSASDAPISTDEIIISTTETEGPIPEPRAPLDFVISDFEVTFPLVKVGEVPDESAVRDGPIGPLQLVGFEGDNADISAWVPVEIADQFRDPDDPNVIRGSVMAASSSPEGLTQTIVNGVSLRHSTATASTDVAQVSGAAEIGGSVLHMVNSRMTSSSVSSDLVLLSVTEGGTLEVGSRDPMIHLIGSRTDTRGAIDINGGVDPALLAASAPIIGLFANNVGLQSRMTTAGDVIRVSGNATLNANVLTDALIRLDGSVLTADGSLINVDRGAMVEIAGNLISLANGSTVDITGNLISLANGSTLEINNGALASIVDGSKLKLTGGSLAVFGSGENALSISNSLCAGAGCFSPIDNLPIFLTNGATQENTRIKIKEGFVPFANVEAGNLLDLGSSAVFVVDGPGNKVVLKP